MNQNIIISLTMVIVLLHFWACNSNISSEQRSQSFSAPTAASTVIVGAVPHTTEVISPTHLVEPPTQPAPVRSATPSPKVVNLEKRWSFSMQGTLNALPVVKEHMLYIATQKGGIYALDTRTGQEQWHVAPEGGVWERSLALVQDVLLVGLPGHNLVALDRHTGQEQWRREVQGEIQRPPLVVGTMVYVGTTFVGPGLENDPKKNAWIYALDGLNGQEQWALETHNYLNVTPTFADGVIYAGGSYVDPSRKVREGGFMRIYALDAANGTIRWTYESEDGLIKRLSAQSGLVYYLGYRDFIYAINAQDGQQAWAYSTENWTPDFTLAQGKLFFGVGNGSFQAIDSLKGTSAWKTYIEGVFDSPFGAPQLVGDRLYMQTVGKKIYALDANTGQVLWQTNHQVASREGVLVDGKLIYVMGLSGELHAFALLKD